jgi:hypothetical protein
MNNHDVRLLQAVQDYPSVLLLLHTHSTAPDNQQVWPMAHEGRGSKLLVEQDFHYPAQVDDSGLRLLPEGGARGLQTLDDAVDDVIATVLEKGGKVVFTDPGMLGVHQHIALILRY